MRNTLLPIIAALCLFIAGVSILNIQLWYSARAESLAGARYAANNINKILDEAAVAMRTAITIASKGCDPEEQYQLGTEAALKPHLRTILVTDLRSKASMVAAYHVNALMPPVGQILGLVVFRCVYSKRCRERQYCTGCK